MAGFSVASGLGLVLGPAWWGRWTRNQLAAAQATSRATSRLAGAVLALASAWALSAGLGIVVAGGGLVLASSIQQGLGRANSNRAPEKCLLLGRSGDSGGSGSSGRGLLVGSLGSGGSGDRSGSFFFLLGIGSESASGGEGGGDQGGQELVHDFSPNGQVENLSLLWGD